MRATACNGNNNGTPSVPHEPKSRRVVKDFFLTITNGRSFNELEIISLNKIKLIVFCGGREMMIIDFIIGGVGK